MDFGIKTTSNECHTQTLAICKNLSELAPHNNESICFDFSEYRSNSPFSNLVLINALKHVREKFPYADLSVRPNNNTYLTFVGFYKGIGIDYGNQPGEAPGSTRYVPITEIDTSSPLFYNNLNETVEKLATILRYSPALEYMLKYVFQESIRNVHEHADTNRVLVAAQKWPSKNLLEIAIADAGCGIAKSLGARFSESPLDLLRLACQPGITALSNVAETRYNDTLTNSGYGLYIMKELALLCKGRFMICSGEHAIAYHHTSEGVKETVYATDYQGLALCLQFRTDKQINFYNEIQNISKRGQREASGIVGAIRVASKSSRAVIE